MAEWGKKGGHNFDKDLQAAEQSASHLRLMDEHAQKALMFSAIRACNLPALKNILQANRSLVSAKLFGYEGSDVYEIIPNSKTKRCYISTGLEKDGFFFPLHVASEAGHKKLTLMLVKAGADVNALDYRGATAEQKCNGEAQDAFYELKGLVFEAQERYEGKSNREGQRTGQGVLYYKPEGYLSSEKLLYRGGFKFGHYHGPGSLYWVGTEVMRFMGKFKIGEMHGRGVEFDKEGVQIYQGGFKESQRDGRGEEFLDNMLMYKGEFVKNTRHGFGIAYFGENHQYIGRFDNNVMAGVGIYCYPNGDRFEGMFYNNKPDGNGTHYIKDAFTGNMAATNAVWQKGRKIKETQAIFCPKIVDLPDERSQNMLSAIAAEEHKLLSEISQDCNDQDKAETDSKPSATSRSKAVGADSDATDWKLTMIKYCKVPAKDCKLIGSDVPAFLMKEAVEAAVAGEGDDDKDVDEVDNQDLENEDMMNDVNGIHFLDFTTLFISYLYVYSAAKVFEGRLANKAMNESVPDFEAVYYLVTDAVEAYNDIWESEFRLQEEAKRSAQSAAEQSSPSNKKAAATAVESKRHVFMTEREKRDEELLKQRAELAAKKGSGQLDPERESQIRYELITQLEEELCKLLTDDGDMEIPVESRRKSNKTIVEVVECKNEFAEELLTIIRTSQNISSI